MQPYRILPLAVVVMTLLVLGGVLLIRPGQAQAATSLLHQISHDPFTNSTSEHQTQVEPDTYSFGSVTVSAFQSGRFFTGGGQMPSRGPPPLTLVGAGTRGLCQALPSMQAVPSPASAIRW